MIILFFSKIFGVSPEALRFILDKKFNRRLLIVLPLTVWAAILYQLNPLFIKWQIDTLTGNLNSIELLKLTDIWQIFLTVVIGFFAVSIIDEILIFFKDTYIHKLNIQSESYLEDNFRHFLKRFDGAFLGAENNIRLIRNLQWSVHSLQNDFLKIIQNLIEIPVALITLIGILNLIHPYLLGIIFVSVILSLLIDNFESNTWRKFEIIQNRKSEQRNELRWRIIWYFNQLLSNGWLSEIYKSYQKRREEYFQINFRMEQNSRQYKLLKNFVNTTANTASVILGGYLVLNKAISIGTFSVFSFYVDRIKGLMNNIGSLLKLILEMRFSLFKIDFLLHIKPKLDYSNIQEFKDTNIDSIEFSNVIFKYPKFYTEEREYLNQMQKRLGLLGDTLPENTELKGFAKFLKLTMSKFTQAHMSSWNKKELKREFKELEDMFSSASENREILQDVSFKLEKGKIYGIVGYNGAGKTTMTKLIKRTLDPSSGEILINGKDLKSIDPLAWRDNIASVEQENFIWASLTVKENLVLGMDSDDKTQQSSVRISDEDVWTALEQVGLKDKVSDLGLIMEENLELSGGQKQLLEIARVHLQKKPIVILDEGTNQLDATKENGILSALQKLKKDCIVIFITHRMTTSSHCDEILVLENGKIAVQGKPRELLESKESNLYQQFWKLQVEGKVIKE